MNRDKRETTITIDLVAAVGDRVLVENYKSKYKPWEPGTVFRVSASVYRDGSYHVSYDVRLDRVTPASRRNPYPRPLGLCVGYDDLSLIEAPHA